MKKLLVTACTLALITAGTQAQDPIEAHPNEFNDLESYPIEESEFQIYDDEYQMQMQEEESAHGLEPGWEPHDQMEWDDYGDGSIYDSEINQYE